MGDYVGDVTHYAKIPTISELPQYGLLANNGNFSVA